MQPNKTQRILKEVPFLLNIAYFAPQGSSTRTPFDLKKKKKTTFYSVFLVACLQQYTWVPTPPLPGYSIAKDTSL